MTEGGIIVGTEGLPQVGRGKIMFISKKLQKEFKDDYDADLAPGDEIIFSKYQGEEIKIQEEDGKWTTGWKSCYKFAIQGKVEMDKVKSTKKK